MNGSDAELASLHGACVHHRQALLQAEEAWAQTVRRILLCVLAPAIAGAPLRHMVAAAEAANATCCDRSTAAADAYDAFAYCDAVEASAELAHLRSEHTRHHTALVDLGSDAHSAVRALLEHIRQASAYSGVEET